MTTNEITTNIEHDEIINEMFITEEHYEDGAIKFCVAYAEDGSPTNGNQYERFESKEDAIEYMENF